MAAADVRMMWRPNSVVSETRGDDIADVDGDDSDDDTGTWTKQTRRDAQTDRPATRQALCRTRGELTSDVFQVGILDVDLCGPSVPYLLNLEEKDVHQSSEGWIPVFADSEQKLSVMSIGFLLKNQNDSVIWRGPKKTGMIKQFLNDVVWRDIDYLIIDTPPGTSDEHITVMESLRNVNCDGAIIVTTPQAVAVDDVLREITFCRKTGIHIIGIIENMSGFVCPSCTECTNIFSSGGGIALSEMVKVPFLAKVPIDPQVGKLADKGQSVLVTLPDSQVAQVFRKLVEELTKSKEA